MVLSGCVAGEIWISTIGPRDANWPSEPIVLEVGSQAWVFEPGMGDGVVMVSSSIGLHVRVLWVDGCSEIVTFTAEPNERYEVRFSADGTATAQQTETTNMGPGLNEAEASPCG